MMKRYLNSPRKALCKNAASVHTCMWLRGRFKTALFIVVCMCICVCVHIARH